VFITYYIIFVLKGQAYSRNRSIDQHLITFFSSENFGRGNSIVRVEVGRSKLGSISPTFLCSAFKSADPKRAKKTDSLTVFFALLGSAGIKAFNKNVGEIDTWSLGSTVPARCMMAAVTMSPR